MEPTVTARRGPRQLSLGLTLAPAMTRADFMEAPSNALALGTIEDPGGLPAGKLVLTGPAGAGKTHLLHIWAQRMGAQPVAAADLPAMLRPLLNLGQGACLVIDDADTVAADPAGQEALFHLHNHLATQRGQMLLAARRPVRDWGLSLPDLTSRLAAATHVALAPPDDALLAAVLVKLFNDRQIRVPPSLIDYLLPRIERSLAAARDVVARLDAAALARGRPVTRALAQEVLPGVAP